MSSVQMNTRIEKSIKLAGDAAIKAAGYTPTKMVNLMWQYMAENKNDIQATNKLLSLLDRERQDAFERRHAIGLKLQNFEKEFEKFCKEHNMPANTDDYEITDSSENEIIREIAYEERLAKYQV